MDIVIDASVSIKWFVPDNEAEEDAEIAIRIFKAIQQAVLNPIQPVHWQAEVIAVLSRIQQVNDCQQNIQLLDILEFPVQNNLETYQLASELAIKLNHHLFDTLYHALALIQGVTLVTADKKYYQKAKNFGNITLLSDYQV